MSQETVITELISTTFVVVSVEGRHGSFKK